MRNVKNTTSTINFTVTIIFHIPPKNGYFISSDEVVNVFLDEVSFGCGLVCGACFIQKNDASQLLIFFWRLRLLALLRLDALIKPLRSGVGVDSAACKGLGGRIAGSA